MRHLHPLPVRHRRPSVPVHHRRPSTRAPSSLFYPCAVLTPETLPNIITPINRARNVSIDMRVLIHDPFIGGRCSGRLPILEWHRAFLQRLVWRRVTAEMGHAAGLATRLCVSVAVDPGHAPRPRHLLVATGLSWYERTSK